jgi:hypothetical protein
MAAPAEEVDEFIDRVDEVSRLIDGLAAGTLPPEYIDAKLAARAQHKHRPPVVTKTSALPHGGTSQFPGDTAGASDAGEGDGEAAAAEVDVQRQAELMRKVRLS